jgi:hypothetical protein
MTRKHFVAVCLRLFVLWLIISAVQLFFIASGLKYFSQQLGNSPIWVLVLVWSVFLVVTFLLWILSAPLATGLLSGVPRPQTPSLSLGDIIVAGCVVLGLLWLKESLLSFISLWLKAAARSSLSNQSLFDSPGSNDKISAAIYVVEITFGLFFVIRPFDIAKWVIRSAPISRAESGKQDFDNPEEQGEAG